MIFQPETAGVWVADGARLNIADSTLADNEGTWTPDLTPQYREA